mmetsp:Transcript_40677/g.73289  ORF Transcript_40677/g.73289 Transcript_40677/m.73289 type:complete len:264 (+) Transcript_40677:287-1078(+)
MSFNLLQVELCEADTLSHRISCLAFLVDDLLETSNEKALLLFQSLSKFAVCIQCRLHLLSSRLSLLIISLSFFFQRSLLLGHGLSCSQVHPSDLFGQVSSGLLRSAVCKLLTTSLQLLETSLLLVLQPCAQAFHQGLGPLSAFFGLVCTCFSSFFCPIRMFFGISYCYLFASTFACCALLRHEVDHGTLQLVCLSSSCGRCLSRFLLLRVKPYGQCAYESPNLRPSSLTSTLLSESYFLQSCKNCCCLLFRSLALQHVCFQLA